MQMEEGSRILELAHLIIYNCEETDQPILEELIKELETYSKRDILNVVEFLTGALVSARHSGKYKEYGN